MRILEINTVNFGSTGHIMLQIADLARSEGHEAVCCFYARRNKPADANTIYIGNKITHNLHKKFSKYTGYNGYTQATTDACRSFQHGTSCAR